MSKNGKILLGIVSFLPLVLLAVYIISFIGLFTSVFSESVQQSGRPPEFMMGNVGMLMSIVPLFIVTSLGLLIYYLIHVMSNPRLDGMDRLVWIIILVFTSVAGYPIYWYMQIRKAPPTGTYSS